jgi:hypothetical protein
VLEEIRSEALFGINTLILAGSFASDVSITLQLESSILETLQEALKSNPAFKIVAFGAPFKLLAKLKGGLQI